VGHLQKTNYNNCPSIYGIFNRYIPNLLSIKSLYKLD